MWYHYKVVMIEYLQIKGKDEYYCGMETTVYESEGNPHTAEHSGVVRHPGDEGMKWIVDKIIE